MFQHLFIFFADHDTIDVIRFHVCIYENCPKRCCELDVLRSGSSELQSTFHTISYFQEIGEIFLSVSGLILIEESAAELCNMLTETPCRYTHKYLLHTHSDAVLLNNGKTQRFSHGN